MKSIEVRQLLKQLTECKPEYLDPAHMHKTLNAILNEYQHTTPIIEPSMNKFKLHRAIKYNEKPLNISFLGCPPPHLVKIGRANYPNQPVFYCCGDPRGTFFELDIKPGDTVVLSKWDLVEEIILEPLGYTDEIFSKLDSDRKCPRVIPEEYLVCNNKNPTNKLINKFLNEKFTAIDSNSYYITVAIAAYFMKKQFNGVVYPSIAMMANAENFALTKATAETKLKIASAKWFRVAAVDSINKKYTLIPLEYSETFTKDGDIIWGGIPKEEEQFL